MLLKIFMFLLLAAICKGKGDLYCDFKENLCNWSNLYGCHFKQETKTPLAGKTGYLHISKNTCNLAAISVSMVHEDPRFGFYYYLNGTGRATIDVYGVFTFSGRKVIWHCDASQGPKWNMAEILVQPNFINKLKTVIIEVNTLGDVTVAIGRIESPKHGRSDYRCPPRRVIKPTTKKLITKKATTKPPPKTTTEKKVKNNTICNFESDLCQWKDMSSCHFKHVKDTPLLGENGYLMLSKDTCKEASLMVKLKETNFQLHYLMNGTGNMSLTLGVHYGLSGRDPQWSCSTSQGPKWHKVDIKVDVVHFDPRISVYIEAKIQGDAIIAIGNIATPGDGPKEKTCPSKPRSLPSTPAFRKPTRTWTTPKAPASIRIVTTRTKTAKPRRNSSLNPYQYKIKAQPASNDILSRGAWHSKSLSSTQSGVLIGANMVGVILLVALIAFSIFMLKKKIRMRNAQRSTGREIRSPDQGFDNQLCNRY